MYDYLLFLIGFFILMNGIAFLIMWLDKGRAGKTSTQRISEGMMFFMATIFGSIGVYAGMYLFRHKTRKWYFVVGIPFIFIQNISFLLVVYYLLNNTSILFAN